MDYEEAEKKLDEFTYKIMHGNYTDDEWLQLGDDYLSFGTNKDVPEKIRRKALGWGVREMLDMITSGIEAERNSLCFKCGNLKETPEERVAKTEPYYCIAHRDGLPASILYADDLKCLNFEKKRK